MRFLDRILAYDCGIITLRARDPQFLFGLAANMIVRNHDADSKTQDPEPKTLYLHWVDYHRRYWTLDHDLLVKVAKSVGADFASISRNLYFVRAFTRDNIEVEENWDMLAAFAENTNLVILDSVSELYETDRSKRGASLPINSKTVAYAIGRFVRICMKNQCPGIVLDHAKMPIHPYLGEVSSVIVEFSSDGALVARILKHPCIRESSFIIHSQIGSQFGNSRTIFGRVHCAGQRTMRSWI